MCIGGGANGRCAAARLACPLMLGDFEITALSDGTHAFLINTGSKLILVDAVVRLSQAEADYWLTAATRQATRRQLLQTVAGKQTLVGAAHIAFPGLGHIRSQDGACAWLPLNYDGAPAAD